MSKYVIDLRPDCKVVQQICAIDKGINIGSRSIGLLDELTDEYVKKNFKDLLEGEYQRGLEDGKKEAESSEAIKQAKADAFNKGMLYKEEKLSEAYQRGLAEGREQMPCDTCEYRHNNLLCADCKWTYGSRYKVDSIGVGDVVEAKSGTIFVVTKITADGFAVGFTGDGNTCCFDITKLTKTGGHYNINEILGGLCDD